MSAKTKATGHKLSTSYNNRTICGSNGNYSCRWGAAQLFLMKRDMFAMAVSALVWISMLFCAGYFCYHANWCLAVFSSVNCLISGWIGIDEYTSS